MLEQGQNSKCSQETPQTLVSTFPNGKPRLQRRVELRQVPLESIAGQEKASFQLVAAHGSDVLARQVRRVRLNHGVTLPSTADLQ